MARTGAPVASWYPAALFAPTVAAAQRYPRLLSSRATSALPGLDAVSSPPAGGATAPGSCRATSSSTAPPTPVTTITRRSQGYQSALRPSSTTDQTAVIATVPASTASVTVRRARHNPTVPIPARALIPGASATV